jgi:hypothetical protein
LTFTVSISVSPLVKFLIIITDIFVSWNSIVLKLIIIFRLVNEINRCLVSLREFEYQVVRVLVKYQPIGENINRYSKTSTDFRKYQPVFQNIDRFPKTSTGIPEYRPISENINWYSVTSTDYYKISTKTSMCQKKRTCTNQYRSPSRLIYLAPLI